MQHNNVIQGGHGHHISIEMMFLIHTPLMVALSLAPGSVVPDYISRVAEPDEAIVHEILLVRLLMMLQQIFPIALQLSATTLSHQSPVQLHVKSLTSILS